jgi:hypothetical protein
MTPAARLFALVMARARAIGKPAAARDLVQPLARYRPADATEAAWREQLDGAVAELRARGVLGEGHRLRAPDALAAALGGAIAQIPRDWRRLADRVLPALGLGLPPGDRHAARLVGRDAWAAAIAARALGLWTGGPPPSLPAACDALAWRRLGLPGAPKRCPPELRALFVQRELGGEAGPPDRLIRLYAARAALAPRPELGALRDALVRRWLAGRELVPAPAPASFGADVREVAGAARAGVFGDRKVFIAAAWDELRRRPAWSGLTLPEFKQRLLAAHRAGELALARADLVAAMDPELVAASETAAGGASFHFIVRNDPEAP